MVASPVLPTMPLNVAEGPGISIERKGGVLRFTIELGNAEVGSVLPGSAMFLAFDPESRKTVLLPVALIPSAAIDLWIRSLPTAPPVVPLSPWNDGGVLAVTPSS